MVRIEMGLTGISRKEAAGIIADYLNTKPAYKGGLTYQYNIGDWTVFMDGGVAPEKADGDAGDDYKVGIGIPESTEEELAGVFKALDGAKAIINDSCKLTVTIDSTGHTDRTKDNLINLFGSKRELIFKAFGVKDGNIKIENDKIVFQLFRATLDANRIIIYKYFCILLNQLALNLKTASKKKLKVITPSLPSGFSLSG
ncbi:amidoligase family protein [Desulfoscipio sp. XC116]|uniref:amidoligase family protein n=1 Tax=Desulfoscipio sp. XC116 TaxID=3144975 RepID=UPI00325B8200